MSYVLIFKSYLGDEMNSEELHYFSNLGDLYKYAATRLKFAGAEGLYDRYDIQVKLTEVDKIPLAA
jgi:hypothetical protein